MIFSTVISNGCKQAWGSGPELSKLSFNDIGSKIGSQLGEVEASIDWGCIYEGIVLAKVVSCEKHPDADKLSVCLIDDGGVTKNVERTTDGLVQVVCGAPNVTKDIIIAWIPPGNTVPSSALTDEPFVLSQIKLRGQLSNGMIASASELSVSDDHEGILIIEESDIGNEQYKIGNKLSDVLMLNDFMYDIENKMFTRRPDCFGNLGIARELSGIIGQDFTSPDWYLNPIDIEFQDSELEISAFNEAPEQVPRFMVGVMDYVSVQSSPLWLQAYLTRSGVKPISNVVDIGNYFSLLTGQPTHAFDYDKVKKLCKDQVTIGPRMAISGEKLTLLGGKEITLSSSDVVIATDTKAIALAGVMGGLDTEVDDNTSRIIIECATFDMYSIRRTSMNHGLFTDAVTRYSKGQSPHQNEVVLNKIVNDLADMYDYKPVKIIDLKEDLDMNSQVSVSSDQVNKLLGTNLSTEEISTMLKRVEFNVKESGDRIDVVAPFWRTDIHIGEDIIEEVGRYVGYDNLEFSLPTRSSKMTDTNNRLKVISEIRSILSSMGANEALTYSFVNADLLDAASQEKENSFEIINSISPELEYYRQSITPSLLSKVNQNVRKGYDNFAMFEMGRCHRKNATKDVDKLPEEDELLSVVYVNSKLNAPAFYQARTMLRQLADKTGLEITISEPLDDTPLVIATPFDVHRSATVSIGGEVIGVLGEYQSSISTKTKIPETTAGFEINLDKFISKQDRLPYKESSVLPSTSKDVTFEIDDSIRYAQLQDQLSDILKSDNDIEVSVECIDIYRAQDSLRRVTFRLDLTPFKETLTSEQANNIVGKAITSVEKNLSAKQI